MWDDLQQAFYISVGPFVVYVLLPSFLAAGILAVIYLSIAEFLERK